MSTNDRKIIRTEHVPTGEMVDFYLSQDVSPSVNSKIRKWEKLQGQAQDLKGERDQEELSDEETRQLAEIYEKVNDLGLQIFSSILDPVEPIPAKWKEQFGYDNKFDFISDCAKSDYVIGRTINFFYSSLRSSTASPEDKDYQKRMEEQVQLVEPSGNTKP